MKIKEFNGMKRSFGFKIAFFSILFPFFHRRMESAEVTNWIDRQKNDTIKKYLKKRYKNIVEKYKFTEVTSDNIDLISPIWIFWWQGEENMPLIVKKCFQSVLNNANGHPVKLITKYNMNEYVSIPDYIIEKVGNGIISIIHLSDIVRISLISQHGGLWLDSTILVTGSINVYGNFYTIHHLKYGHHPSDRKWTQFLLGGVKNNPLFLMVRDLLFEYWKTENFMVDYFLIDYCIYLAYDSNLSIKNMIDSVPYSNPELYYFLSYFDEPYIAEKFKEICESTNFHKLKWKEPLKIHTNPGELTYYGYLLGKD